MARSKSKVSGIASTKLASLITLLDQVGTQTPIDDQKMLAGRRIQILKTMIGSDFLDTLDLTPNQQIALKAVTAA